MDDRELRAESGDEDMLDASDSSDEIEDMDSIEEMEEMDEMDEIDDEEPCVRERDDGDDTGDGEMAALRMLNI
jgi:hypothetical protein